MQVEDRFLNNVAKYIYKTHKHEMGEMAIVFPGRRASVFFKRHLSQIGNETLWMPRLLTVSDFFQSQSDTIIIDDLKLLFSLYLAYANETKSTESFDQFYFWGSMLLNDFDDIDKYLCNPEKVFENIKDLNDIDLRFSALQPEEIEIIKQFWTNFDPKTKSEHKEYFINIWQKLPSIYANFKQDLHKNNQGYEGMVFRDVAEKVKQKGFIEIPWTKVFFVGLNALTPCEKAVMSTLQKAGKATFFWDYDEYYLNRIHEAGLFLKENIKQFPPPDFGNSYQNLIAKPKKIWVMGVPSNIGQAKAIQKALDLMPQSTEKDYLDTSIVLGDENLLLPTLYSIPKEVDKINVTMGYPMKQATVFHFIKLLTELQQLTKPGPVYYFKQVMALMSHPYLSFWSNDAQAVKEAITKYNSVYISNHSLAKNSFFESIFQKPETIDDHTLYFSEILYKVVSEMKASSQDTSIIDNETSGPLSQNAQKYSDLEREFIFQAFTTIQRLGEIAKELNLELEANTYYRILLKNLQSATVNFIGEPLAGLQVMGALETRGLDFANLVMTSMNEGVFPQKTTALSFIPYNLRRAFSMPTYQHQDAIYAYYFYRLLQRSENIALIYNSNAENSSGGEMSRFIYQLKYDPKFEVSFENINHQIKGNKPAPITIEKNEAISKVLEKFVIGKGKAALSPSALNTFKNCSLRFYFRYILGLKDPEAINEEIDHALFGSILHMALKIIYNDWVGNTINREDISAILKDPEKTDHAIDKAFAIEYFNKPDKKVTYTGRNIIIKEVIRKYLTKLLDWDCSNAPFEIESLEDDFYSPWPVFQGKFKINIGGTIDRIDIHKGSYRIIDYKTGTTHNSFKTIQDLFLAQKNNEGDAIFQVFLYTSILQKLNKGNNRPILPLLIYLRDIYKKDFSPFIQHNYEARKSIDVLDFQPYLNEFSKNLTTLIEQIFGDQYAFTQTEELKYCRYCEFKDICQRK